MKRTLAVLMTAALLVGIVATDASARGGLGGAHLGGFRGGPYMGGNVTTTSPILNPSSGYTTSQAPEVAVSPASPGSVFH
jgi:hypothetical protein